MRDLQASQPSAVNTDEDVFDRVEPLTDDEIDYSQLLNSRTNEITSNPNESIMVQRL